DIPIEEAQVLIRRGEKPAEHMVNSLYLEWFCDSNERVVIESAAFDLQLSAPEWRMTPDEETQRVTAARGAWRDFVAQLDSAIQQHRRRIHDPEGNWDEHD